MTLPSFGSLDTSADADAVRAALGDREPAALPWLPLYVDDWLSSATVLAMTPAQELAFWRLLAFAWKSRAPGKWCAVPDDAGALAQLSRMGDAWATDGGLVRAQFDTFTAPDGSRWLRHPKSWALWLQQQGTAAKRSHAGASGRAARDAKRHAPPPADAPPSDAPAPSAPPLDAPTVEEARDALALVRYSVAFVGAVAKGLAEHDVPARRVLVWPVKASDPRTLDVVRELFAARVPAERMTALVYDVARSHESTNTPGPLYFVRAALRLADTGAHAKPASGNGNGGKPDGAARFSQGANTAAAAYALVNGSSRGDE